MSELSELAVRPWETARLLLRAPTADDLEAVFALHADPIANRFSASGPMPTREASAELLESWLAHWREHGYGYWAIASREEPQRLIGFGGVMNRCVAGVKGLHLYFRFLPQAWGQGLASEMALAALELVFDTLHEASVLAVVLPQNTPSRKTLERIGMLLKTSSEGGSLVYEMTAERFAQIPRTPPAPTPFGA
ncbi:GNAT family N-acetyltransferase [Pelomonas sp. KK5]|uniref:GNAT family N-acetyltransferase n=1 Tax=Pelomonas sp. KK5 TaxID=1855730 RepID=UPI001301B054|nr:GNAT family N-acetyltransferase [Pelomonas sp. KK5]